MRYLEENRENSSPSGHTFSFTNFSVQPLANVLNAIRQHKSFNFKPILGHEDTDIEEKCQKKFSSAYIFTLQLYFFMKFKNNCIYESINSKK